MHIRLLTTETPHHRYYAERLYAAGCLDSIFVETEHILPSFVTHHEFEDQRDAYEREVILGGVDSEFSEFAPVREFSSLNTMEALEAMSHDQADIVFVFGTGRLTPEVISLPGIACLNLHGGNPEDYRGLDSHLWAIYHRDFANLVTTLHYVSPQLDTGDIVFSSSLVIPKHCELYQLRSINTRVCVDVSLAAITLLRNGKSLPQRKQTRFGRYYSSMPSVLKNDCVAKFAKHTEML